MSISFKHLNPSHLILGGNVGLIQFHWHETVFKIHKTVAEKDSTEVSVAVIKNL